MKSFFPLILTAFLFIGCNESTSDDITSISINPSAIELYFGETRTLTVSTIPEGANLDNILWTTTNNDIVKVESGTVTATGKGNAIITATSGSLKAHCTIIVGEFDGYTEISLLPESLTMNVGETESLEIKVKPENIPTDYVVWETSNERVATVENGVVTAIGYGKAKITASSPSITTVCEVEVNEKERIYKLIWSDEFDGTEIDTDKWNFETGGAGWGNQEKQYYTDRRENSFIEDGCLVIEVRKENYQSNSYTSARLTTQNKLDIKYGKLEARISLPSGKGTWPAFWMMPAKSVYGTWPRSGEIDIMEHVGSDPDMISHALHTAAAYGGSCWDHRTYPGNVENVFHVYAVEWVENYYNGNGAMMFYIDNKLIATKNQAAWSVSDSTDWPFDQDFFVILNVAIGGSWGGTIDDSIFNSPVQMKVDYVRVYQLETSQNP